MSITPEAQLFIEEEQEILRRVVSELQSQLTVGRRRLDTEEDRAQELTAQIVNARRDTDKQMLASDEAVSHGLAKMKRTELKGIEKLVERPYFARIVLEEEDETTGKLRKIEFRLGTSANSDCRIIDWRKAPISKLYYEYKEGEDYCEIIQGRERNGTILLRNNVEIEHGELKRLSCRLGTFQLIDGSWHSVEGYGSRQSASGYGALPDVLSLITPEQFRAITEEAACSVLIQGVAGSGKTTVALYRLSWLLHEGNSDITAKQAVILLRSPALKSYIQRSLSAVDLTGVNVMLFSEWSESLVKRIIPGLSNTEKLSRPQKPTSHGALRVLYSLALLKAVDDASKSRSDLSPQEYRAFIRAILSRPELILPHDETRLLDRDLVKEARLLLESSEQEGAIHPAEDVLLIHLAELRKLPLVPERTQSGKFRHIVVDEVQDFSAAELAVITGAVEEMSQLTLVGDRSQAIDDQHIFPGWDRLRQFWSMDESLSKYVQLAISHRSTVSVMRLAHHIQGSHEPVQGNRQGKPPLWYHCPNEDQGVEEVIGWLGRVIERFPESLIAVLCKDRNESRQAYSMLRPTFQSAVRLGDESSITFEEGIVVTTVSAVKGLEFPNILIWNPSKNSYPNDRRNRNLLYVAVTRTQDHLALVTWDKPAECLPSVESSLVRGIIRELDVPEEDDDGPLFPPRPGDDEEANSDG